MDFNISTLSEPSFCVWHKSQTLYEEGGKGGGLDPVSRKIKRSFHNSYKKPGKIYCSTFRGHRDSIIKRLVKSYANKEK